MKSILIGLGQAGGKITDKFMEYDRGIKGEDIYRGLAVNSARVDLKGLKEVSGAKRVLIGETLVKGHGVGANNQLGAEIAKKDIEKIMSAISQAGTEEADAFLIVTSLGGGTGSGSAPIVAKHLKRTYSEPVYVLGVLPADNEGGVYHLNAARSLKTLSKYADSIILVDNGIMLNTGESLKEAYSRINREMVKRFDVLFRGGEVDAMEHVPEMVVDASEISNTIEGMEVCTIGYVSEKLPGKGGMKSALSLVGKKEEKGEDSSSRILQAVTKAVKSNLLLPCDYRYVRKALIVIAGPPEDLSRAGLENAKEWLETNIKGKEVRGGDYPIPGSDYLAACVLISGITGSEKVNELFEKARTMQEVMSRGMTEEEYENLRKTSQLMSDIEDLPLDES